MDKHRHDINTNKLYDNSTSQSLHVPSRALGLLHRRNISFLHTSTLHIIPKMKGLYSMIHSPLVFVGDSDVDISFILLLLAKDTSERA